MSRRDKLTDHEGTRDVPPFVHIAATFAMPGVTVNIRRTLVTRPDVVGPESARARAMAPRSGKVPHVICVRRDRVTVTL